MAGDDLFAHKAVSGAGSEDDGKQCSGGFTSAAAEFLKDYISTGAQDAICRVGGGTRTAAMQPIEYLTPDAAKRYIADNDTPLGGLQGLNTRILEGSLHARVDWQRLFKDDEPSRRTLFTHPLTGDSGSPSMFQKMNTARYEYLSPITYLHKESERQH